MEWIICITCKKCNRQGDKYLQGRRNTNKSVGCSNCGLSCEVELKEQTIEIGDLKISIYIPFYGS
jgi:transcription elongation factor Elf1